eukprot:XP_024466477.1 polygalacturonase [Populus trichocarpa]
MPCKAWDLLAQGAPNGAAFFYRLNSKKKPRQMGRLCGIAKPKAAIVLMQMGRLCGIAKPKAAIVLKELRFYVSMQIKSWARPSSTGFIGGVRLIGDAINNVRNPATIDEHQYCRQNPNCPISLNNINISSAETIYNVQTYGAKPNGKTDSTQAFLDAWAAACGSTDPTIIYIPEGRYLLGSVAFTGGNCKSPDIIVRIDGTLIAPEDYRILGLARDHPCGIANPKEAIALLELRYYIAQILKEFNVALLDVLRLVFLSFFVAWMQTLSFVNSNNIKINGLLSLNSQMFHIVINGCQNVQVQGVRVIAAGDSPNTDGIHVQLSTDVVIMNSSIKTGDDCISIGPGTKNLWIERVRCGPGHGISIGSLAKTMDEAGVQNVTVKSTIFTGTTNGFRIKSWARHSTGFAQAIRFIGATMINVQNPIIIDQNYCPHNLNCPNEVSGIQISDVIYQGIRGTSATPVAIKFDCSFKYPCKGITLQNVNLTYLNKEAQSTCTNAIGKISGQVQPDNCL